MTGLCVEQLPQTEAAQPCDCHIAASIGRLFSTSVEAVSTWKKFHVSEALFGDLSHRCRRGDLVSHKRGSCVHSALVVQITISFPLAWNKLVSRHIQASGGRLSGTEKIFFFLAFRIKNKVWQSIKRQKTKDHFDDLSILEIKITFNICSQKNRLFFIFVPCFSLGIWCNIEESEVRFQQDNGLCVDPITVAHSSKVIHLLSVAAETWWHVGHLQFCKVRFCSAGTGAQRCFSLVPSLLFQQRFWSIHRVTLFHALSSIIFFFSFVSWMFTSVFLLRSSSVLFLFACFSIWLCRLLPFIKKPPFVRLAHRFLHPPAYLVEHLQFCDESNFAQHELEHKNVFYVILQDGFSFPVVPTKDSSFRNSSSGLRICLKQFFSLTSWSYKSVAECPTILIPGSHIWLQLCNLVCLSPRKNNNWKSDQPHISRQYKASEGNPIHILLCNLKRMFFPLYASSILLIMGSPVLPFLLLWTKMLPSTQIKCQWKVIFSEAQLSFPSWELNLIVFTCDTLTVWAFLLEFAKNRHGAVSMLPSVAGRGHRNCLASQTLPSHKKREPVSRRRFQCGHSTRWMLDPTQLYNARKAAESFVLHLLI